MRLIADIVGRFYAWEFVKGRREMRIRVEGQLIVDGSALMLTAPRQGPTLRIARGRCADLSRGWPTDPRALPLMVFILPRLSSVLAKPPPSYILIHTSGKCLAPSQLNGTLSPIARSKADRLFSETVLHLLPKLGGQQRAEISEILGPLLNYIDFLRVQAANRQPD